MTSWKITTDFITEATLEHGNWSAIEFETEEEAMKWWVATPVRSVYKKVVTLTDPSGKVVETRREYL